VEQYRTYTTDELAADPFFRQWVTEPDDATDCFWQDFLIKHPSREETVFAAYEMVRSETIQSPAQPLTREEKTKLKQGIYRRLNLMESQPRPEDARFLRTGSPRHSRTRSLQRVWLGIAASIALTGIVALWLVGGTGRNNLVTHTAVVGESKQIRLPDRTLVVLHPNSSLSYSKDFNRTVRLQGEAYFDVTHDPQAPFTIRTDHLGINVLGTEFHVKDRSGDPEVALVSGKVHIEVAGDAENELLLVPGEKARLSVAEKKLRRSPVDTRMYTALAKGNWFFEEASLGEIAAMIQDYYDVEVVFENKRQQSLTMSAFIPITDLETLANVISRTMDCRIHLTEGKLFIQDLH